MRINFGSDRALWVLHAQEQQGAEEGCQGCLHVCWDSSFLLLWVSATEGQLAWDIHPIWDWSLLSSHGSRQLRNLCRLVTAQMTTDTEIRSGLCAWSAGSAQLLSTVFVSPSTADLLLFRGKPFNANTLIQGPKSWTWKGRAVLHTQFPPSFIFFFFFPPNPTLHMPLVLSVLAKYLCSSPVQGLRMVTSSCQWRLNFYPHYHRN